MTVTLRQTFCVTAERHRELSGITEWETL